MEKTYQNSSDREKNVTLAQSLLFDIEAALELRSEDVSLVDRAVMHLQKAADHDPLALLDFIRAFGRSGSESERQRARDWAERNGFLQAEDQGPEPVAIWGVVAVIAIAFLVGSGCDAAGGCGRPCPTAGPCPGGSSGGTGGGSSGTD